jgi:S-sulfo-L-cysteine synthase (3-phospho-L-serine-dependent)
MSGEWFVLVESNTTGSGRLFGASARRLGLRPVMLAKDPARYPYVAVDEIEAQVVDTTDAAAILRVCAALGDPVAGVTSSSEYSIGIASEVARALDRPHPDPDAIRACRDKYQQRVRLARMGVPGPAFAAADSPAAARAAAAGIGLPVVVKPVAGSGSIGVRRCTDLAEVAAAASAVLDTDPAELALPPQHAVVVEQYLAGDEYSVEMLDEIAVGITRKHLGPEPYFVEIGHDFPAPLAQPDRDRVGAAAIDALRALGLGWGGAHVELRLTEAGPRIVEVNPRLAGGMIPRMVQEATGIDMIFHIVAKAAGRARPPVPTRSAAASIRFLVADMGGRLFDVSGVDVARAVPGVVDVALTRAPGHDVILRNSFQDRLGYVIAADPDGVVAARAAETGLRALHAQMAPRAGMVPDGSLT